MPPPEPVSPELVLVDPELTRRERARLCERARLEELLDVENLRRAVIHDVHAAEREAERVPPPSAAPGLLRRRVLPAALLCSLVVNGYIAADLVVSRDQNAAAPVPVAAYTPTVSTFANAPTLASAAPPSRTVERARRLRRSAQKKTAQHSPRSRGAVQNKTAVRSRRSPRPPSTTVIERKLVSLVLGAPARKLPRAFIDPKTGLVRNNVQVTCRAAERRSYICRIQLAHAVKARAFIVRYHVSSHGEGTFSWDGYSRSK